MSEFYSDMQKVASEVLAEFKQGTVRHVRITPGNGPKDNPGPGTEVLTTLDATVKGASYKYVRDGFATATDKEVIAAVVPGVTISINDFIEIDGVRHKVIQDVSPPAAGVRVVWKFLVRK